MENGPQSKFNMMTTPELYEAFITAVNARDNETVKECLLRDGLKIKPDGFCSVPMYFARINDRPACEFLEGFQVPATYFVTGALVGNQFDLARNYLKKIDSEKEIVQCAYYAVLTNNLENIWKLLNPYQASLLKKVLPNVLIPDENIAHFETLYSKVSAQNLIKKYPNVALYILILQDDERLLFKYLEEHNTTNYWQFAANRAAACGKFALLGKIQSKSPKLSIFDILKHVVKSGDMRQVLYYLQKYESSLKDVHYEKLVIISAQCGEFAIAQLMFPRMQATPDIFAKLSLEAQTAGYDYTANKFALAMKPLEKRETIATKQEHEKIDFNSLTGKQLHQLYINAVKQNNLGLIKECLQRNADKINIPNYLTDPDSQEFYADLYDDSLTQQALVAKYPQRQLEIAARFGDVVHLSHIASNPDLANDEDRNRSVLVAMQFGHYFELVDVLIPEKTLAVYFELAKSAIYASNIEKTMLYAGEFKNNVLELVELALTAISVGELRISISLLNLTPEKNKYFKACAQRAQENEFTYIASYYNNLDKIYNSLSNTPIEAKKSIPDFDNMTMNQIFDTFVEAVLRDDQECIAECIKRDGFKAHRSCMTVPVYFARNNEKKSCELLSKFKPCLPQDFIIGALWGNHHALARHFLAKHDYRNSMKNLVRYAAVLGNADMLVELWYEDQKSAIKEEVNRVVREDATLYFEQYWFALKFAMTNRAQLLKAYPKRAHQIAIAYGDEEAVFEYLGKNHTKENWQNMVSFAFDYNVSFVHKILNHELARGMDFDFIALTKVAIDNSARNEVLQFMSKVPDTSFFELAEHAVSKGEILIARDLLQPVEHPDYERLSKTANEKQFDFASEYFKDLQTKKIRQKSELAAAKAAALSKLIHLNVNDVLFGKRLPSVQNEIIAFDDVNFLLDQVLIKLEKNGLLHTISYRGNIFIEDNEPAYEYLKTLCNARRDWLVHTNFLNSRARLIAKAGAKVTIKQIGELYNELETKLKEKPATKTSPNIARRETEKPDTAHLAAPSSSVSASGISKKRHYDPMPDHKPSVLLSFPSEKEKKKKPHANKKGKTKQPPTSSLLSSEKNAKKENTPPSKLRVLPTLGTFVPNYLKETKMDWEALRRKADNAANNPQSTLTQLASPYIELLDEMMQNLHETQKGISAIATENGLLIHDLAMLDLLFKINRDLNDEPFATDLIHGAHLYLQQNNPTFISISSLVQECISFGSDQFVNHYSITREKYDFTKLIRSYDHVETSPEARFELIKALFKLQGVCYRLCKSENPNIAKIGRYALSGIIMIIGEQFARINDTEINEQLAKFPIFKVLHEYRVYRSVRHGIEQEREVNGLFFIDVRKDWEEQMDHILANFTQNYFLDEYLQNLDMVELQSKMKKLKV